MLKEKLLDTTDADIVGTLAYWAQRIVGANERDIDRLIASYGEEYILQGYNRYSSKAWRKPLRNRMTATIVNGAWYRYNHSKTTTNPLTNWEYLADIRTAQRIRSGEYQALPLDFPNVPRTGAHVSTNDPHLIAYYPTERHILSDKAQQIKPGRFLRRYFPEKSDDWVREKSAIMAPSELRFYTFWDDMFDVYRELADSGVVRSCMSEDSWGGVVHPLMVYDTSDVELAVLYVQGKPVARALYNVNNKHYPMIYGQWEKMKVALDNAGFVHGSLCGAKINKIAFNQPGKTRADLGYEMGRVDPTHADKILMPYIDYKRALDRSETRCTSVDVYDSYVVITHNGEYEANQYEKGYIDLSGGEGRRCCDLCGDRYDADDGYWLEREEMEICPSCYRSSNVVSVNGGPRRDDVTCTYDYAALHYSYIDCAEEWYIDHEAAYEAGYVFCDWDGEWYPEDDLVYIEDNGTYYPISEEGSEFFCDPETLQYISADEHERRQAEEQESEATSCN